MIPNPSYCLHLANKFIKCFFGAFGLKLLEPTDFFVGVIFRNRVLRKKGNELSYGEGKLFVLVCEFTKRFFS